LLFDVRTPHEISGNIQIYIERKIVLGPMFGSIYYYICALAISLVANFFIDFDIQALAEPYVVDDNLDVQRVIHGLSTPTDVAFLGPNDFLILEQYNGTVQRIKDFKILPMPLLDLNVVNDQKESGLLGIEVVPQQSGHPFIFLYYTETQSKDGGNLLGSRLYRYTFVDDLNGGKLVNRTLLLDLPGATSHNGGNLVLAPDGNLYVTVGDLRSKTKAQNLMFGEEVNGGGGILRLTPNGEAVGNGILGSASPLDKYFAYGIRNSYGIDFDPVTNYLWDTENGPASNDEINLVKPGFNSGWQSVIGFIENKTPPKYGPDQLLRFVSAHITNAVRSLLDGNATAVNHSLDVASEQLEQVFPGLYDFNGKGIYSDPEFIWPDTVAPTAIQFYNSSALGQKYLNQMFVAEYNFDKILNFALNSSRTGLDLSGNLSDLVANTINETDSILFGKGFDGITDIDVGPDGFLYIVERNSGTVSRIIPKSATGIDN
jgi:glucose/arabinose dehydrogenase